MDQGALDLMDHGSAGTLDQWVVVAWNWIVVRSRGVVDLGGVVPVTILLVLTSVRSHPDTPV